MKGKVGVLMLLCLCLDPVLSLPPSPDDVDGSLTCQNLDATYGPRVERFVNGFQHFLGSDSTLRTVMRSLVSQTANNADKVATQSNCRTSLNTFLLCTANKDVSDQCTSDTVLFATSDLADLVYVTIKLQERKGCAVNLLRSQMGQTKGTLQGLLTNVVSATDLNVKHPKLVLSCRSRSTVHTQNFTVQVAEVVSRISKSEAVVRDLVANRISPKGLSTIVGLLPEEAKGIFTSLLGTDGAVDIGFLGGKLKEITALISDPTARKFAEDAIGVVVSMDVSQFQQVLAERLSGVGLGSDQISIVLKVIAKAPLTAEDIMAFLGLSPDALTEILPDLDQNSDGTISYDELLAWAEKKVSKHVSLEEEAEGLTEIINGDGSGLVELFSPTEHSDTPGVRGELAAKLSAVETFAQNTVHMLKEKLSHFMNSPLMTSFLNKDGAAKNDKKTGGILGLITKPLKFMSSAVENVDKTEAGKRVTGWIKIIIWGVIYLFCLVVFVISSVWLNNQGRPKDEFKTWVGLFTHQDVANDPPAKEKDVTEARTNTAPTILVQTENAVTALLEQNSGLNTFWRTLLWSSSLAFCIVLGLRYILWSFFGSRALFVGSMHEAGHKWFLRDDVWSMAFVILLFIPLVKYTVDYFLDHDALRVSNVYLELIGLVAAFQTGIDILQRQIDPELQALIAAYIETHRDEDFVSDCKDLSMDQILNRIFVKFLAEHSDELAHCDFSQPLAQYINTDHGRKAAIDLLEHLTVTSLCQDLLKYHQRQKVSTELGLFETVLVRLTLGFQQKQSGDLKDETDATSRNAV